MSKVQSIDRDVNRLVDIVAHGDTLVVRKLSTPYKGRLTAVAFLLFLACVVFAFAFMASHKQPQIRVFLWALGVAVIVMAIRMFDIRNFAAKEELFRFDLMRDSVEKNGQELAKASEIDHMLVRRIRREDDEDLENSDYALV